MTTPAPASWPPWSGRSAPRPSRPLPLAGSPADHRRRGSPVGRYESPPARRRSVPQEVRMTDVTVSVDEATVRVEEARHQVARGEADVTELVAATAAWRRRG